MIGFALFGVSLSLSTTDTKTKESNVVVVCHRDIENSFSPTTCCNTFSPPPPSDITYTTHTHILLEKMKENKTPNRGSTRLSRVSCGRFFSLFPRALLSRAPVNFAPALREDLSSITGEPTSASFALCRSRRRRERGRVSTSVRAQARRACVCHPRLTSSLPRKEMPLLLHPRKPDGPDSLIDRRGKVDCIKKQGGNCSLHGLRSWDLSSHLACRITYVS